MKLVASAGIILISSCGHTSSWAQAIHPVHFSASMTTLPFSRLMAPNLHASIQDPIPTQPSLHSPLTNPDSTASLQDLHPANLAFPAALPLQAMKAILSSAGTAGTPRISAIASIASWLSAGHSAGFPAAAIASAHSAQVALPQPPRPPQSTPGRRDRILFILIKTPPLLNTSFSEV